MHSHGVQRSSERISTRNFRGFEMYSPVSSPAHNAAILEHHNQPSKPVPSISSITGTVTLDIQPALMDFLLPTIRYLAKRAAPTIAISPWAVTHLLA